ncbi:subtilase family N-terminal domain-containing protein [Porphyromonas macacae]|uniref:subtilase family N-terminal domain-containing protein n=1 Tax=Porphyromonas macacae TaxID=28115 RepID=UPI000A7534DE|nr:subtilase family N-terminal domain-containing protein [Porphyromonas macacae]
MKKRIIILLGFVVFLSMGCADRRMDELADQTEIAPETDNLQILPGIIRVKLTRAAGDNFSVGEGGDNSLRSGRSDIDRFLRQVGATKMTRVFRPAGKYEERSRREGLHLWYDVIFDEKIPVTRAASEMKVIPGVEIIEKLHRIEPTDSRPVLFAVNPPVRTDKQPFNDHNWVHSGITIMSAGMCSLSKVPISISSKPGRWRQGKRMLSFPL